MPALCLNMHMCAVGADFSGSVSPTLMFFFQLSSAFLLPVDHFKVTETALLYQPLHKPWSHTGRGLHSRTFTQQRESRLGFKSHPVCFSLVHLRYMWGFMHCSCTLLGSATLAASGCGEMTAALCWQALWTAARLIRQLPAKWLSN